MNELASSTFDKLSLDDTARRVFDPVRRQLIAAVADGKSTAALEALEAEARVIALDHTIAMNALVPAVCAGLGAWREAIAASGAAEAEEACRRLSALERDAVAAVGIGYVAGLEEKVDGLIVEAERLSPRDAVTGAIKPAEIVEQLALEVNRCQRMDLSLGLVELAVQGTGKATARVCDAEPELLHRIAATLRDNLRRYDSIGCTEDGEFLIILPDISRRGLLGSVERLRRELTGVTGGDGGQGLLFAMAHFDYVDVGTREMLAVLDQGMDEARAGDDPTTYL
jgi:GGDEF domain-containing protein